MKQAALAWWKELEASMKRLGFTRLISDAGIFIDRRLKVIVIAYVDDCVFIWKDLNKVKTLKSQFMEI